MDIKELLRNPTPELVDEYLILVNELTESYNTARAKYDRAEQRLEDQVDDLLFSGEEKQKTKATARVNKENPKAREKMKDLYREKRTQEKGLEIAIMNYYHARDKLRKGEEIDIQVNTRARDLA